MTRYLNYDDENEYFRHLIETVSSDDEPIFDDSVASEDEEYCSNHDSSTEIETETEDESSLSTTDFYIGKDKVTKWQNEKYRQNVRTPSRNIISKLPGNTAYSRDVASSVDAWNVLFDSNMLNMIVKCTNIYIESIQDRFTRERDAKKTDEIEIKAFLGLLYLCGTHKSSHTNLKDLYATNGTGIDIFPKTMSRIRFLFLMRCLRFDNINDRQSRRGIDKLAPIRDFFETFVKNCKNAYTFGEFVTIHEKLEPFRGRCGFRQYMPKKPSKYGIKIFALVDSRVFYTWNMEIYAGKHPDEPFKIDCSSKAIVMRLMTPLFNSGRNLTTDNWYTGYELAQELLKNKITMSLDFKKKQQLFRILQKNVVMLSTMHTDDKIDETTMELKKPDIITFYNLTKGAVDVVDEMAAAYTTARLSNRWPMVILFSVLNVAAINARIFLMSTKNPPIQFKNRRFFLKTLGLVL
ncbi:PiggyBac transposable element-derived protein 4, partial [Stegodyphus mimosarum]